MTEVDKDFAEAADLLSDAENQTEVVLESMRRKIKIKKVTIGDLSEIMQVAKDNEVDQYIWLVYKGLVHPKLSVQQVRKLSHGVLLELAIHIQKFSGLDKESMKALENFLATKS